MTHPLPHLSQGSGGTTFVVTDIEADGHSPLASSMLSFASVAVDGEGGVISEFEAVLAPRADKVPNPATTAWWATEPEAYAQATRDPQPAETVMPAYADWVEALPGRHAFAAAPLIFDGVWMDHYLWTYAGARVWGWPHEGRKIFSGSGICISTMAGALRGADYADWSMRKLPESWYGDVPHTHRAIDDARGYAHVLKRLFEISRQMPKIAATESVTK